MPPTTPEAGDWATQTENPWDLVHALAAGAGAETGAEVDKVLRRLALEGDREAQWSLGVRQGLTVVPLQLNLSCLCALVPHETQLDP
jgi:hypothetical protein